ncbi:FtsB family cell division protein [Criibacterium bergeronii]|uniref:Septum formation initiator family protein n=1 Tax=Criibacterium bergeronii TaxID=1871336 RepID=A0A371IJK6_9FIRM|nr:septum formation initiator family protein [Criibacterium bergeronii]RDY20656.1 septum formation initiator family protein [Criibacterium bergeronii]TRW27053.1 septum formation initiator family protein [Criibacterium bergeronii]
MNSYRNELSNNKAPKKANKPKSFDNEPLDLIFKAIFVVMVIYFVFTFYKQDNEMKQLKSELAEVTDTYENKEKELAAIKKDIKDVNTDKYMEKRARQDLKMVKSNETVYVDKNREKNLSN